MTLISKLAIASLLAGISLPAIADDATSAVSSALDSTVSTEAGGDVSIEAGGAMSADSSGAMSAEANGSADVNANASATGDNYGSLISTIQTGTTADVSAVTDATTVSFVTVSSLKADANANALDEALEKNADAHAKLGADVTANAALNAKLTAAGYEADQVLAIVAAADGSLTVYIDDRA